MARMVPCYVTGVVGDSSEFYKIGKRWFKDKETYIKYLISKDITYKDILELLTEDNDVVLPESVKKQIIEVILNECK